MSSRRERYLIGLCAVLAFLLLFSERTISSVSAKDVSRTNLFDELKIFTDVLAIVQRDYVKEVESRQLVEGAIKGLLTTLDPHSGYLDPEFYQDLQVETKGQFGGLGIEITIKDGLLVVVSPMEGSPAERAGIRSGDAIVKIDGVFAKDFSLIDAVKKLRGPKGSSVVISVFRKGIQDLFDVKLVRDNIEIHSVRSKSLGDGFGYVRLSQFMEKTSDDLRNDLQRLKKEAGGEIKGLILDMRNNPGGLLNQAIRVSDLFLNEGVIVYTEARVESQRQKFFAHVRGTEPEYPMIVLINSGSASASEIVAGALKDHGRALLLGTQTFGKGSVQTIVPLENGGAVRMTTALYYTKSGHSIQALGIKPDIEMDVPDAQRVKNEESAAKSSSSERIREKDLPGAIHNPDGLQDVDPSKQKKGKINAVPVAEDAPFDFDKATVKELLARDAQLQRAFDLLKTFNIFKREPAQVVADAAETADTDVAQVQ